jgi:hypothetical protein
MRIHFKRKVVRASVSCIVGGAPILHAYMASLRGARFYCCVDEARKRGDLCGRQAGKYGFHGGHVSWQGAVVIPGGRLETI